MLFERDSQLSIYNLMLLNHMIVYTSRNYPEDELINSSVTPECK